MNIYSLLRLSWRLEKVQEPILMEQSYSPHGQFANSCTVCRGVFRGSKGSNNSPQIFVGKCPPPPVCAEKGYKEGERGGKSKKSVNW